MSASYPEHGQYIIYRPPPPNRDMPNQRRLIVSMVENLKLDRKKLTVEWEKPFDIVAKRPFHETRGVPENQVELGDSGIAGMGGVGGFYCSITNG